MLGAQRPLELLFPLRNGRGGDEAIGFNHSVQTRCARRRIILITIPVGERAA
jgi:hypothetical protein